MDSIPLPRMNELYKDRTLFITGASGFVGKVMIEKMLRSLPGIRRIVILIRPAKGKSGRERWKEIEKLELFNRIRRNFPERLAKVVTIEGDISQPNLGISQDDLNRVLDETSMVFHCAATVRFNAPLKEAVELNMRGVTRVISLCHRMPKLECFLHCSTCYVNADKQGTIVDENVYPPPCDPHKLIESDDWLSESLFESIGTGASKSYGNTYCFTKCLAEHIVLEDAATLPALIFRPAIVGGIWRDGIPGWADCYQGIAAMLTALGTGALARVPIDLSARLDTIPVDIVASAMIVSAAYRMRMREKTIPVIHCNSSTLNPMIFGEVRPTAMECAFKYPWTRTYHRVGETYAVLKKFLTDYTFQTDILPRLMEMMTEEDRETFELDVRKVNWNDYIFDLQLGIKVFLMKDDIVNANSIERARRNVKLHQIKDFIITFFLCYVFSVICTGSTGSWQLFLPLTIILHCYCSVFTYNPRGVPSIEEYKRRVENAMGELLK
uniref:Fatty acyl-CoA reductase n=1 Tax=Pristionchus pacificus TaxID=54126 RepID=A0A2A6CGS3_PRIPA|eukprot:PDM77425.1 epimerase [Pristionchus pacificus]